MSAVLDLGPLSWVKSEIDSSLERASIALRAFGGDPERGPELKACRNHLHQASGAVQIVGLEGVTRFFAETEALLAELESGAIQASENVCGAVERAIEAIGKYLSELLDGAPDQPLRLFSAYREVVQARGAPAAVEADLYFPDVSLGPAARERPALDLARAEALAHLRAQRARFQRGFVRWLRTPADVAALEEMRAAVDAIEETQSAQAQRAFWWAAGALIDALVHGDLEPEPGVKHLCSRIEQQMRRMIEGSESVAERLLREALYWVARAGIPPAAEGRGNLRDAVLRARGDAKSPRAVAVKQAFRLEGSLPPREAPADLSQRVSMALAVRDAIDEAKESWNKFAAGAESALATFARAAAAIAAQAPLLRQGALSELAAEIARAATALQAEPGKMSEALAMEVATALLMAENAAENYQGLASDFAPQAQAMRERLAAALAGAPAAGAGGPLIDELTRRAQEKLAVASTIAEMQENLHKIEQALDAYFRDPAKAGELAALEPMIHQVAGALELLGEEEARGALERCAARIRAFARALARPALEDFEELAQVLSGLGFYIDALRHGKADFAAAMQPVRVRAAPAEGVVRAASVESELERQKDEIQALYETWRTRPGDGKMRAELKARLKSVRKDADLVANQALGAWAREVLARLKRAPRVDDAEKIAPTMAHLGPQAETPSADAQRLKDASVERIDAELLAIFLEEAVGVLVTIAENLAVSRVQPASTAHLVTVRRSFHTLKGSGRMVGLARLAEAAWAVEQVMNLWLQQERSATPELLALIELAHGTFSDWVARLQRGQPQPDSEALLAAAERVRRGGPALAAAPAPEPAAEAAIAIGEARISPSLFTVFVNEARQHLDTLERNLAAAAAGAPREEHTRAAHTLAGICGTVNIPAMQEMGLALERALDRLRARPTPPGAGELELLARSIAALREMYAGVVERRAPVPRPDLGRALEALAAEPRPQRVPSEAPRPMAPRAVPAAAPAAGRAVEEIPLDRRERRIEDEVDAQLAPVFLEEAAELAPKVGELLRAWRGDPANLEHALALQRVLHTFKGSARMAGVMSLGELMHNMETRVENAATGKAAPAPLFDDLEASHDRIGLLLERVQQRVALMTALERAPAAAPRAERTPAAPRTMLRVRTELVEKLVNQAGEVAITRSRIEGEMRSLKGSLVELTENVARLRRELREIEIQAESQMQARVREAEEAERAFDPLEIDRFTRFQEITRFMAESVNDLSTVHQHITKSVDDTDSALSVQSRLTRELQQELMRIRMVPIGSLAERLHRLARQTAKELGKRINLDIHGAQVELDRSVLERMAAPLEHMVRNAVIHGIEPPALRAAAGKPEMGEILLDVRQEGNEVTLDFSDDGAGLDLERIRARALAQGLLREGEPVSEQSLAELVFVPGFSTAEAVTEIAGRGVGMDVVKNEVSGLGGRIELASLPGKGARFVIRLPLTTAVTQTVLVKSGSRTCALPAVMVEQVQHLRGAELERVRAAGQYEWAGKRYPLAYLPDLLGEPGNPEAAKRFQPVLLLRSGADSVALLVDEMLGNQENVVKNLGPQLARVPGVAGITVLGSGEIVLILNPVPLARLGPRPQRTADAPLAAPAPARPKVMVVDDSLTVRKITGRLLTREGYEVLTAKDGVEALELLAETTPDVMLVDIEMPRMDGFDLTRNVRADARLKRVPIIMITSRTAAKHRGYAAELGVDVFLGKPYREEELLGHIAAYIGG